MTSGVSSVDDARQILLKNILNIQTQTSYNLKRADGTSYSIDSYFLRILPNNYRVSYVIDGTKLQQNRRLDKITYRKR